MWTSLSALLDREAFARAFKSNVESLAATYRLDAAVDGVALALVHELWYQKYLYDLKNGHRNISLEHWRPFLGYLCLLAATHKVVVFTSPNDDPHDRPRSLLIRFPNEYLALDFCLRRAIAILASLRRRPVREFIERMTIDMMEAACDALRKQPSRGRNFLSLFGID